MCDFSILFLFFGFIIANNCILFSYTYICSVSYWDILLYFILNRPEMSVLLSKVDAFSRKFRLPPQIKLMSLSDDSSVLHQAITINSSLRSTTRWRYRRILKRKSVYLKSLRYYTYWRDIIIGVGNILLTLKIVEGMSSTNVGPIM